MRITECTHVLPGYVAVKAHGLVQWVGRIENLRFGSGWGLTEELVVAPESYEQISRLVEYGRAP